jgi:hypothetical protein
MRSVETSMVAKYAGSRWSEDGVIARRNFVRWMAWSRRGRSGRSGAHISNKGGQGDAHAQGKGNGIGGESGRSGCTKIITGVWLWMRDLELDFEQPGGCKKREKWGTI